MLRNDAAVPAGLDAYGVGWTEADSVLFSVDDSVVWGDGVTIPEVNK